MLDDSRRLRVLAEMGIDVYRLRSAPAPVPVLVPAEAVAAAVSASASAAAARIVVVSTRGVRTGARVALFLKQLPRVLGIAESLLAATEADDNGTVATLPHAPAYLLLGSACATACAAHLTLAQLDAATLALVAEPQESLRDADGKRALWQTLKPLARRLRADRV